MARGWESKGIEAQQEESTRPKGRLPTPDELAHADRRRSLELTRARMVSDLDRASAAAHRTMLEHAIAAVDEQIAALG